MSSPAERIALLKAMWEAAASRRPADLKEVTTVEQRTAVFANVDALESAYLDALASGLRASGGEVEAAFTAAKKAAAAVDKAYRNSLALADKIRAVSGAVAAAGNLLAKGSARA